MGPYEALCSQNMAFKFTSMAVASAQNCFFPAGHSTKADVEPQRTWIVSSL